MKKKLSVIVCLVLILSLMTGCTTFNNFKNAFFSDNSAITNVEKSERTIKFGVYQPLTGPYKDAGNQEKIGIELANELYPEVLGRKIELVYADNQGDMYVAETVIKELIAQEQPDLLVVAGDIYDVAAPGANVQKLLSGYMLELKKAAPQMPVVCISGNHDSSSRHEIFQEPWRALDVHMIGKVDMERSEEVAEGVWKQANKEEARKCH